MQIFSSTTDYFSALAELLQAFRPWWSRSPFLNKVDEFTLDMPSCLSDALRQLPNDCASLPRSDNALKQWSEKFMSDAQWGCYRWNPAVSQNLTPHPVHVFDARDCNGIPGRKLQQIEAFLTSVADYSTASSNRTLDWCGGKGYLASLYYRAFETPCVVLERDEQLCISGRHRAERLAMDVLFHQCDVLRAEQLPSVSASDTHVALHACGELHRRVVDIALATESNAFIAPCCYHLGGADLLRPRSILGRSSQLFLSRDERRIAVAETSTASRGDQRRRATELRLRHAFQAYRATVTEDTSYYPLPSIAKGKQHLDSSAFFAWACKQHAIEPCPDHMLNFYISLGEQRRIEVERMDTLRHCFKRPLEYFMTLDLVHAATDLGRTAQLIQFCSIEQTPRNLMIVLQ